ncbi:MAG: AAC(3) family N-acetyltransferase [Gemmatimonadota bacterium]
MKETAAGEESGARRRLAADLAGAGVRPGGLLLVHSSLSSLGWVPGGPDTVIGGLLDALGPEGTLLLPALSYASVGAEQPVFDVRRTPACVGAIPERFRAWPGVRRSLSPTHSVCGLGPLAAQVLGSHQLNRTPCGAHSPFRALRDRGGSILFLGCGLRPNTSMHGVEELSEPPYLFCGEVEYTIVEAEGTCRQVTCRRHGFAGWAQRYDRLADLLPERGLRAGRVLAAATHLVEAPLMWERADAALRRDPYCLVEAC